MFGLLGWLVESFRTPVTMLRLLHGSLFWVEFNLTHLVGVWKLLVSFSVYSSGSSLILVFVLALSIFNISFWESAKRLLSSDVISPFKEAFKLSKTLLSTLGDFVFEGPGEPTSWSKELLFSITIGETKYYHSQSSLVDFSSFSNFLLWTSL